MARFFKVTLVVVGLGIAVLLIGAATQSTPAQTFVYRTTVLNTTAGAFCLPHSSSVKDIHSADSTKEARWVQVVEIKGSANDCTGLPRAHNGQIGVVLVDDLDS